MVLLAAIGLLVPSQQWGLSPWKWIAFVLIVLALIGATVTLFSQSKEDLERDKRDAQRDKTEQAIMAQLKSSFLVSTIPDPNSVMPPVNFNAAQYFNTAHHSLCTADVEKRIRIAAAQNRAHYSPEDFYAKFIGVGLVSYFHDITWAYIWKSQFLMLAELNRQGGVLPIQRAKAFYDLGAKDYPGNYASYTFEQWLNFLLTQALIVKHPSDMIEITVGGRDFLSYSAHFSRTGDMRRA